MCRDLPAPKDVKDLFEELLGRAVALGAAEPVPPVAVRDMLVSLYVEDDLRLAAVVGMDLPLAVYAGAALGLVSASSAAVCIEEHEITPMIAENVTEVSNILSSLLNKEGTRRVRMYRTFLPGQQPPADAVGFLLALGRRLDLTVEISGYGTGLLAVTLAN